MSTPCPCLQDGFPAGLARSNGFQRHATLLVYLNSTQEVRCCETRGAQLPPPNLCRAALHVSTCSPVQCSIQTVLPAYPRAAVHWLFFLQGGATRFDMLNLAVQPQKGKALLFFPAFADGTSDPR